MKDRFYDGPEPPKFEKRREILKITSPIAMQFVIISHRPYAVIYHWINGRSQQCRAAFGDCEGCQAGSRQKWCCYLHAFSWGATATEECFIEISASASQALQRLTEGRESLRGTIVSLARTKGGIKGKYLVDVKERVIPSEELPEVQKPDSLLKKLWAAKRS